MNADLDHELYALRQLLATTPVAVYTPASGSITTRIRGNDGPFTLPDGKQLQRQLARLGVESHVLVYGVEWRR